MDPGYTYDVAVSFAGEQRPYVLSFVQECRRRGLTVFYDADQALDLWGRNLILELRKVYGGRSVRTVVVFLSKEYLAKPYPMDEFQAAVEQGLQRDDVYLLPVVVGDVQPPPHVLNPAVLYLRADDVDPAALADKVSQKIKGEARSTGTPFRSLKLAPTTFDSAATLTSALGTVGARFREHAVPTLRRYGYDCRVTDDESGVAVQVEKDGKPVCGMDLWRDGGILGRSDQLALSFAWPTSSRSGRSGWAEAVWDVETQGAALTFTDLSLGAQDRTLSIDEFAGVLWEKIADFVESYSSWPS